MDLAKFKQVFISGIGGIGVSAVARFLKSRGVVVIGSDAVATDLTRSLEREGIKIYYEQKTENITFAFDCLIYTAAEPATHPERQRAKELKIPQKSYFEFLGELSRQYKTVAISGTNGKSTTTAMLAGILLAAALDPTVIVGSKYEKLTDNFRRGYSEWFLAEACEYRAHMLLLQPWAIVLTNIMEEHLDFYKDLNHIVQTFQQYVNGLRQPENLLVYNYDDVNIRRLTLPKCRRISYGLIPGADLVARNIRKESGRQSFHVVAYGQDLGEFELQVPGDYNIYNALAALAMSLGLDVPCGLARQTLKEYRGIWRRFEILKNKEITVVSDYAHHPDALQNLLRGAKEFFPGRRLVAIFQPHQHDRTKKLFTDFVKSFDLAEVVIIPEIFEVVGREETSQDISSKDLVAALTQKHPKKEVFYAENLIEATTKAKSLIKPEDVVLVIGAGDVYKVGEELAI